MYCADAEMVPEDNIRVLAEGIRDEQVKRVQGCRGAVEDRLEEMPSNLPSHSEIQARIDELVAGADESRHDELHRLIRLHDVHYIVSGSGEFLARWAAPGAEISLSHELGSELSSCAPAYAVAVLAAERRP
jgi:uncharacterized hydantoinase/oxoprolinase family protein